MEGMGGYRQYTPHVARVTCHAARGADATPRAPLYGLLALGVPPTHACILEAVWGRVPRTHARRASEVNRN